MPVWCHGCSEHKIGVICRHRRTTQASFNTMRYKGRDSESASGIDRKLYHGHRGTAGGGRVRVSESSLSHGTAACTVPPGRLARGPATPTAERDIPSRPAAPSGRHCQSDVRLALAADRDSDSVRDSESAGRDSAAAAGRLRRRPAGAAGTVTRESRAHDRL